MRSRTFPIALASLLLAVTFFPELAHAGGSEIEAWTPTEAELNAMTPEDFGAKKILEWRKIDAYTALYEKQCSKLRDKDGYLDSDLAKRCLNFGDQISRARLALVAAADYYEFQRLLPPTGPDASLPPALRSEHDGQTQTMVIRTDATAASEEMETYLWDSIPNQLGERDDFVRACSADKDAYQNGLEVAEKRHNDVRVLGARSRTLAQQAHVDAKNPGLDMELAEYAEALASVVSRQQERASEDNAPIAELRKNIVTDEMNRNTCMKLYTFAIGADERFEAVAKAASRLAYQSYLIVQLDEGQQAAERTWRYLNGIAGDLLYHPLLTP